MRKQSFFYRNGLSIVLLSAMIIFWLAQFYTGWLDHNQDLQDEGKPAIALS